MILQNCLSTEDIDNAHNDLDKNSDWNKVQKAISDEPHERYIPNIINISQTSSSTAIATRLSLEEDSVAHVDLQKEGNDCLYQAFQYILQTAGMNPPSAQMLRLKVAEKIMQLHFESGKWAKMQKRILEGSHNDNVKRIIGPNMSQDIEVFILTTLYDIGIIVFNVKVDCELRVFDGPRYGLLLHHAPEHHFSPIEIGSCVLSTDDINKLPGLEIAIREPSAHYYDWEYIAQPFINHANSRIEQVRTRLKDGITVQVESFDGNTTSIGRKNKELWQMETFRSAYPLFIDALDKLLNDLKRDYPKQVTFGKIDHEQASDKHYMIWGADAENFASKGFGIISSPEHPPPKAPTMIPDGAKGQTVNDKGGMAAAAADALGLDKSLTLLKLNDEILDKALTGFVREHGYSHIRKSISGSAKTFLDKYKSIKSFIVHTPSTTGTPGTPDEWFAIRRSRSWLTALPTHPSMIAYRPSIGKSEPFSDNMVSGNSVFYALVPLNEHASMAASIAKYKITLVADARADVDHVTAPTGVAGATVTADKAATETADKAATDSRQGSNADKAAADKKQTRQPQAAADKAATGEAATDKAERQTRYSNR